eukprot:2487071-Pleurochrysis_carterae.AAC.1
MIDYSYILAAVISSSDYRTTYKVRHPNHPTCDQGSVDSAPAYAISACELLCSAGATSSPPILRVHHVQHVQQQPAHDRRRGRRDFGSAAAASACDDEACGSCIINRRQIVQLLISQSRSRGSHPVCPWLCAFYIPHCSCACKTGRQRKCRAGLASGYCYGYTKLNQEDNEDAPDYVSTKMTGRGYSRHYDLDVEQGIASRGWPSPLQLMQLMEERDGKANMLLDELTGGQGGTRLAEMLGSSLGTGLHNLREDRADRIAIYGKNSFEEREPKTYALPNRIHLGAQSVLPHVSPCVSHMTHAPSWRTAFRRV